MKTVIYGCSDDLIEIDGDVSEEANHIDAKDVAISCSDGTKASISYDGNWYINLIHKGSLFDSVVKGNPEEEPHDINNSILHNVPGYSDALILNDGIEWVKIGRKKFKRFA